MTNKRIKRDSHVIRYGIWTSPKKHMVAESLEYNNSLIDYKKYDAGFFKDMAAESHIRDLELILSVVDQLLHPKTILDVGCGAGAALLYFGKKGCFIQGIDGEYIDYSCLLIDRRDFTPFNLEHSFIENKSILKLQKYDLALALEVAEHLTPARGESFVSDLTAVSDCVLFSAALPGHGGTNHVNERPVKYWMDLFAAHDFTPVSCIRPLFRNCNTYNDLKKLGMESRSYANNTVLYVRNAKLSDFNINLENYQDDWEQLKCYNFIPDDR